MLQNAVNGKRVLYTIFYSSIVLLLLQYNSIRAGQGVHHHSLMTVFGVSLCLHEGVQQWFIHTDGPNTGWHEEFWL